MPGLRKLTSFLPSGWPERSFYSYAFLILIQYPVSRSFPTTYSFYFLMLPTAVMLAINCRAYVAGILRDSAVRAFLLLFAYIILHALLLSFLYEGAGKTLLNTLDTAVFFLGSVAFFARADEKFIQRFF